MPAKRRYVDPSTGDYVLENGAPKEADGIAQHVALCLKTRRGSSIASEWGSRFHTVNKIVSGTTRLVERYAIEAVQHLIDRKAISDVSARAYLLKRDAIAVELSYKDRSGRQVVVPYQVPVR